MVGSIQPLLPFQRQQRFINIFGIYITIIVAIVLCHFYEIFNDYFLKYSAFNFVLLQEMRSVE